MTGAEIEPADEPLEGRVLREPTSGLLCNADHWPAFRKLRTVQGEVVGDIVEGVVVEGGPAFARVWHDEMVRAEERGRLDRAGCECESCLGDKYSGEDFY